MIPSDTTDPEDRFVGPDEFDRLVAVDETAASTPTGSNRNPLRHTGHAQELPPHMADVGRYVGSKGRLWH